MIKRLVKMTFKPEHVQDFIAIFNSKKDLIGSFEGCTHVELLQDTTQETVFFTYSLWDDPSYLEAYRHSELFKTVWAETKVLFDAKPEAWSVNRI
jgi:autoinducer 2-degrading protein